VFKLPISYEYTGRNEHLSYGGHHEIADIFGVDYDESRELFSCQRPSNSIFILRNSYANLAIENIEI
jgi:hypothetical protein